MQVFQAVAVRGVRGVDHDSFSVLQSRTAAVATSDERFRPQMPGSGGAPGPAVEPRAGSTTGSGGSTSGGQ